MDLTLHNIQRWSCILKFIKQKCPTIQSISSPLIMVKHFWLSKVVKDFIKFTILLNKQIQEKY